MNTILKTGAATATLLLTALLPGAAFSSAPERSQECRISPTLVDAWARHGQQLPKCVVNHNLLTHHYGDDRRS